MAFNLLLLTLDVTLSASLLILNYFYTKVSSVSFLKRVFVSWPIDLIKQLLKASVILRHTSGITSTMSGTTRYYEILRGTTGGTTKHYEVLQDTTFFLQDFKSRATRYYDMPWHYKNYKEIQDAIIGWTQLNK